MKKLILLSILSTFFICSFCGCGQEKPIVTEAPSVSTVSEDNTSDNTTALSEISDSSKEEVETTPEIEHTFRLKAKHYFETDENSVYDTDECIYDDNGILLREGTLVYEYDEKGNVIKKTRYMDPELTQIYYYNEYTYDDNGNMLSDVPYNISFIDNKPVKSEYEKFEYNEKNQLTMRYRYWGELVVARDTVIYSYSYTYDENDKLLRMNVLYDNSFDSGYTLYIYDENELLIREEERDSRDELINEYKYSYDERGNVTLKEGFYYESDEGELFEKYVYKYDDNNNLIMESNVEMYPESEYIYGVLYEWEIVE